MSALLAAGTAGAQKIGYAAPSTPGIGSAFFGLVLVLGLILALAWLLKRMPGTGLGLRPNDQLRLVTSLSVGGKEKLAVVEVGGQQLLVGICAGGISVLHTLEQPLPAPVAPTLPNFSELLAKRLRPGT